MICIKKLLFFHLILLFCIPCFLQSAEDYTIVPYTFSIQQILLHEKTTKYPNLYKWSDGIDAKTVCSLCCTNKESYNFIKSIRKNIQTLVREKSDPSANPLIDPLSIISNESGNWCAYGTQRKFPYFLLQQYNSIFFGNTTSFWHHEISECSVKPIIRSLKLGNTTSFWHHEINESSAKPIIRSLKEDDQKSVFCLTPYGWVAPTYIIEPDSGQIWDISCIRSMRPCNNQFNIGQLEKTFSLIINIRLWLEAHSTKIGSSYQRDDITAPNPITCITNSGCKPTKILCTIDLRSPLFPHEWWDTMRKVFCSEWHMESCRCTTKHIDPLCKEKYEQLDEIATQENAFELKKEIGRDFANRHLLHEIKNSFFPKETLYCNPFGEIVIADNENTGCDGSRTLFPIKNIIDEKRPIQSIDYTILAAQAEEKAAQWIEKEGLLYKFHQNEKSRTQELYLLNLHLFQPKNAPLPNVLKLEFEEAYTLVESYAEKDGDHYIYLSMAHQNKSIFIRRSSWHKEPCRYKGNFATSEVIPVMKSNPHITSFIFQVDTQIAADAMHYFKNTYNSKKQIILEIAEKEIFSAMQGWNDENPGFMPYFNKLKIKGVDVEELMNDPYYKQIHHSNIYCYPYTFKERLYAATTTFGNCQLNYPVGSKILAPILTYLGTNLILYPFFPSWWQSVIPWVVNFGNLLLNNHSSRKRFAVCKALEIGALYTIGRLLEQSGTLYAAISVTLLAGNALARSFLPFKTPVKTIWESWPVQQHWKTMQQSQKTQPS